VGYCEFFNPVIALLLICIIPMAQGWTSRTLLAFLGETTGGSWLVYLISVDAVLVFCGAVLTSFVGFSGLLNRMTLDNLTKLLLKNKIKGF
jgi:amino acid transporter